MQRRVTDALLAVCDAWVSRVRDEMWAALLTLRRAFGAEPVPRRI